MCNVRYGDAMGAIEVPAREFRNHTVRVLDDIEAGTTVYLTRNGRRIAKIEPIHEQSWGERAASLIGGSEPYDSGLAAHHDDDTAISNEVEFGAGD